MMTRSNTSRETIRNRLHSANLNSLRAPKKPMISAINKLKRLKWAREHKD
jgi:hypothetical protein